MLCVYIHVHVCIYKRNLEGRGKTGIMDDGKPDYDG